MQVGTGCVARHAFQADEVTRTDHLVDVHQVAHHVAVHRREVVAVVDLDRPSSTARVPPRKDHLTGLRRVDRSSCRLADIDAEVIPGEAANPGRARIWPLQLEAGQVVVPHGIANTRRRGAAECAIRRVARQRCPGTVGVGRRPIAGDHIGRWAIIHAVARVGGDLVGFAHLDLLPRQHSIELVDAADRDMEPDRYRLDRIALARAIQDEIGVSMPDNGARQRLKRRRALCLGAVPIERGHGEQSGEYHADSQHDHHQMHRQWPLASGHKADAHTLPQARDDERADLTRIQGALFGSAGAAAGHGGEIAFR